MYSPRHALADAARPFFWVLLLHMIASSSPVATHLLRPSITATRYEFAYRLLRVALNMLTSFTTATGQLNDLPE
ncbi:hypothetical protein F4818DRAFT_418417 [Hypoxylon cercidicola]|nr:hypothetical protein F4818DRAFT_418417 [Hypoxylon cercidicola]